MLIIIVLGGIFPAGDYLLAETKWVVLNHQCGLAGGFGRPAIVVTSYFLSLLHAIFSGPQL
jgi:hypothetical protein